MGFPNLQILHQPGLTIVWYIWCFQRQQGLDSEESTEEEEEKPEGAKAAESDSETSSSSEDEDVSSIFEKKDMNISHLI